MPNRILRPWVDSEAVNSLSDAAEVFFVRLIQCADDYGRFYGTPMLLKSYLFPLKDKRVADISRWIAECVKAGLIADYEVAGKRFVEIRKFNQRLRLKGDSKFPAPPDESPPDDSQMTVMCQSCDSQMTARSEKREARSDIKVSEQSSSTFSPEPGNPGNPGKRTPEKIFFDYDGDARIHGITQQQLDLWKENFPAVDVETELKSASAWLDGNRKNRKTDVKRFLVNWLKRQQDRAPRVAAEQQPPQRHGAGEGDWRV